MTRCGGSAPSASAPRLVWRAASGNRRCRQYAEQIALEACAFRMLSAREHLRAQRRLHRAGQWREEEQVGQEPGAQHRRPVARRASGGGAAMARRPTGPAMNGGLQLNPTAGLEPKSADRRRRRGAVPADISGPPMKRRPGQAPGGSQRPQVLPRQRPTWREDVVKLSPSTISWAAARPSRSTTPPPTGAALSGRAMHDSVLTGQSSRHQTRGAPHAASSEQARGTLVQPEAARTVSGPTGPCASDGTDSFRCRPCSTPARCPVGQEGKLPLTGRATEQRHQPRHACRAGRQPMLVLVRRTSGMRLPYPRAALRCAGSTDACPDPRGGGSLARTRNTRPKNRSHPHMRHNGGYGPSALPGTVNDGTRTNRTTAWANGPGQRPFEPSP